MQERRWFEQEVQDHYEREEEQGTKIHLQGNQEEGFVQEQTIQEAEDIS